MKKFFAFALAAMMTLSLTACGGSGGSGGSSSAVSNSTEPSSQSTGSTLENIKQKGKLVMVTSPDYAPYEFIDLSKLGQGQEQYVGADIEVARYLAQQLGVELEIQAMDFDAVLAAVSEGKCDIAIAGIAPNAKRRENMAFSQIIGSEGFQGVLVKKENLEKFSTVDALNQSGVKIAAQNGSIQQTGLKANFPNATEVPIAALANGVMEVQTGKCDAMIIASGSAEGFINSYDDLAMVPNLTLDLDDNGTAVAMPITTSQDFIDEVNKILDTIIKDGLYEKWTEEGKELAAAQGTDH